jgi:Holliday junction resolvase RusA-like endonuclease
MRAVVHRLGAQDRSDLCAASQDGGRVTLAFKVFGVALAKGNLKPFIPKGMKFPILTESNRNVRSWQQLVSEGASHALQELPESERMLLTHGVRLTVRFFLPRPKKYAKRGVFVPHCTAPDVDKLARAIGDALTNVAYHDDRQVTELVAGKYYAEVGAPAYVDIRVEAAPGNPIAVIASDLPLFAGVSA